MEWQEITVKAKPEAVEAVADTFYQLGAGGVVIEDPELLTRMAASGLWDSYELPEESLNRTCVLIKGYLPVNEELPEKLEELKTGLAEIALRLGQQPCEVVLATINEEDWANSWKVYFKPLKIGNHLVIRPTWEPYTAAEGEIVLDLDPGMAFGTGSHATTVMCARYLEKYVKPDDFVIDVGTGTGILAMSAARLGAKEVMAIDCDLQAVRVARENIKNNQLENRIQVIHNDLLVGIGREADVLTANIITDVIIRMLPQARKCLRPGGIFIVSGVIAERRDELVDAGRSFSFVLLEESREEDWVAQVWKAKEG